MKVKKLDPETVGKILSLKAQGYSAGYISRRLGLHPNTVSKHIKLEADRKAMASPSFQRHSEDLTNALRALVLSNRTEVLQAALAHFRQESPEYTLNGIPQEILSKMELLADSRGFRLCHKCPICQAIYRREKAKGVPKVVERAELPPSEAR